MMVFISNVKKKLHVSAYSGHLQVLTTFLLKVFYSFYYIANKHLHLAIYL